MPDVWYVSIYQFHRISVMCIVHIIGMRLWLYGNWLIINENESHVINIMDMYNTLFDIIPVTVHLSRTIIKINEYIWLC